jgi:hypothetical protein
MNANLFDPDNLILNNSVIEEYTSETKQESHLFPVDNCDGFWETIQGMMKELPYINDSILLDILPECKTEIRHTNILGEYFLKKRFIKYYDQAPGILEITKIHERFHAIHHLTLDVNNQIWKDLQKLIFKAI